MYIESRVALSVQTCWLPALAEDVNPTVAAPTARTIAAAFIRFRFRFMNSIVDETPAEWKQSSVVSPQAWFVL
jgi:hypothetical protein